MSVVFLFWRTASVVSIMFTRLYNGLVPDWAVLAGYLVWNGVLLDRLVTRKTWDTDYD